MGVAVPAADPPVAADGGEAAPDRDWALPLVVLACEGQPHCGPEQAASLVAAAEQALRRFATEPQRLPRRPQLLPRLLSTLNDDAASGREIAGIIARDPALAAHLLKLANSALYRSQPAPVESLDRAVAMVGTGGLRHLIAVALMQPVMQVEGGVFGRLPERVWEHTQHAALAAARHARTMSKEDAFAAQLLALLHGLGAIVTVQALRDACASWHCAAPEPALAARVLQAWAPRIGCAVAKEWALSARLMQALDEQAHGDLSAMGGLGRVLALAAPEASAAFAAPAARDAA